ncbi:MAG: hypothetical protein HC896_11875 [Bacteroidales bacterium]|nr:hypothetical protein [Bacteroidales bacterium]
MRIDRNNYEAYFVDYFEGNLNRELQKELQDFLVLHADLKAEFEEFSGYGLTSINAEYMFKEGLKKRIGDLGPVNDLTIDEYSIAYLENDLNPREKAALLAAIEKTRDLKGLLLYISKQNCSPMHC